MYYKDEFSKEFNEELKFHEYLSEVDERAKWFRVPSTEMEVLTVQGNNNICTPIEGEDTEEVLRDTAKHTGLLLKADGNVYQLGSTAITSLLGRARIGGSALSDIKKKALADILNECLKVAKGKALIRYFEGKVRAVLSGDDSDYAIMSMPEVFMVSSAYVNGDFQDVKFQKGFADHYSTTAVWEVGDEKLTKAYQELLTQYGKKADAKLRAAIRITTSDVGASGANIFYSLIEGGHTIILGEDLKVMHKNNKNCKGIEDFTTNMESVFEYYKEVLKKVTRLCDIQINYPANAMAGVMNKEGFGKKQIAETVESFKAAFGDQPCSAYEVYCGICEILYLAQKKGESGRKLLKLEEKISRCISKRWLDYDIPGEIKY